MLKGAVSRLAWLGWALRGFKRGPPGPCWGAGVAEGVGGKHTQNSSTRGSGLLVPRAQTPGWGPTQVSPGSWGGLARDHAELVPVPLRGGSTSSRRCFLKIKTRHEALQGWS